MAVASTSAPEKRTTGRSSDSGSGLPAPPGAAVVGALIRGVAAISPGLAARLAARAFVSTRRHPVPAREREWMASAEPFRVSTAEGELAAWRWGERDGQPVLLVHGWDGRGSQLGALAIALAAHGWQPVALDMPGHGESPGRSSNLFAFAAGVAGAVCALGGVHAVVAHSFGAAGTTVALREPLAVERLVFVAPSEDFDHFIEVFGGWLRLPRPLLDAMQQSIERRFGTPWKEVRPHVLAPGLRQALLVVHDEDDREVPVSHGRTYAAHWPRARLLATRGLGHRRILREPAVVDEVVRFLGVRQDSGVAVRGL